jgi:heat shock protein HslJ
VPDTRVTVTFEKFSGRRNIGWSAGCNSAGARVRVTDARLRIGEVATTLIRCPRDLADQDAWLTEFFEADPLWRLTGGRLVLTTGSTVIELEAAKRAFNAAGRR